MNEPRSFVGVVVNDRVRHLGELDQDVTGGADASGTGEVQGTAQLNLPVPVNRHVEVLCEGDKIDQRWRGSVAGSPFTAIDLVPLRRAESMSLIGEFMGHVDELAESCLERAAGNPLFLEQLLRNAREGSLESLPNSIASLVLARLDRLRPDAKQALQAASVVGQRFDSNTLNHLLAVDDFDCTELIENDLIRSEGNSYLFSHALVQEGVYGSLVKARKQLLHKRCADWFDSTPGCVKTAAKQAIQRGCSTTAVFSTLLLAVIRLHGILSSSYSRFDVKSQEREGSIKRVSFLHCLDV